LKALARENMPSIEVTLLVSHPVRSSSKLAREARRPYGEPVKLKSITAATSHVPTAP
jgi:hypothetical protein